MTLQERIEQHKARIARQEETLRLSKERQKQVQLDILKSNALVEKLAETAKLRKETLITRYEARLNQTH